jgi:Beta-lactamase enzyme family
MFKTILLTFFTAVTFALAASAQTKTDKLMIDILGSIDNDTAKKVLAAPDKFRVQIIYTQIDRNHEGIAQFKNHHFHVNAAAYFNPASMVKMPMAFLALEKLNKMNVAGVNLNTHMRFDRSYEKQVAMAKDSSSADGYPSIAHFIKRAFLISENDPYNRLYQFVTQQTANRSLQEKGYQSARITRQFMGYTEDQNRHTNGIAFLDGMGRQIHYQLPAFNTDSFAFPPPVLIGNAHINRNDELVNGPFDFTRHNNISLEDMQRMLQAVIEPESVSGQARFNLKESDRKFLLQYLSQYPSETNSPKYDESIFYDSYVKFFFKDNSQKIPKHLRIFNKVGWAYGFLTDVSYIRDTLNNIEYMLSATVYVNSDGIVNDSKYDEESVGFPFLKAIGERIYNYDLTRKRKFQPALDMFGLTYGQRNPMDKKPAIKIADN